MRKPEVTIENHSAVYDYYDNRRQNRPITKMVYWLLNTIYNPQVDYAPGAKEQIEACAEEGVGLEVLLNHVSRKDPMVAGGVVWKTPLRNYIGRVAPLGKDQLFQDGMWSRAFYDETGGIPVFRTKNHDRQAVMTAGRRLVDVAANRLVDGGLVAIYPENEINEGDPTKITDVYSGMGHIACRAYNRIDDSGNHPDIRLLTIGLNLGIDRDPHGANAYIGNVTHMADVPRRSATAEAPSPADVTRFAQTQLQDAVTMAVKMRANRDDRTVIDLKK